VRAEASAGIHEDQVDITLTTTDGRTHHLFVEHAIGSLERPMTDANLESKFRGLAHPVLQAAATDKLIALCWRADTLADITEIARAAVPR
jgi:2-methylcitrate dehydratase PrpD